ncbi:MAG TPA: CBS domain-containing protein [Methylomirabilota bacterium]|jgi:CBS domain-containing protein|nr:CBS domain-containing protein [Methylomirabilota bacterium]
MKVRDIMTSQVEIIHPDVTLQEAATKMSQLDVEPLPVCDGEQLIGMLTDRDITVRATAKGCDPTATTVREVMTPEVVYCFDDQDVETAAQMMEMRQIRRVPVLNRGKRLVGIVSLSDLAVEIGNRDLAGETLERASTPAEPTR